MFSGLTSAIGEFLAPHIRSREESTKEAWYELVDWYRRGGLEWVLKDERASGNARQMKLRQEAGLRLPSLQKSGLTKHLDTIIRLLKEEDTALSDVRTLQQPPRSLSSKSASLSSLDYNWSSRQQSSLSQDDLMPISPFAATTMHEAGSSPAGKKSTRSGMTKSLSTASLADSEIGPCLEFILHGGVLKQLTTIAYHNVPEGMCAQVLEFFSMLVNNMGMQAHSLLPEASVRVPLVQLVRQSHELLLEMQSARNVKARARPTSSPPSDRSLSRLELNLVSLINTIFRSVARWPFLLDLFFARAATGGVGGVIETRFPVLFCLLDFVTMPDRPGQVGCESLLLAASLIDEDEALQDMLLESALMSTLLNNLVRQFATIRAQVAGAPMAPRGWSQKQCADYFAFLNQFLIRMPNAKRLTDQLCTMLGVFFDDLAECLAGSHVSYIAELLQSAKHPQVFDRFIGAIAGPCKLRDRLLGSLSPDAPWQTAVETLMLFDVALKLYHPFILEHLVYATLPEDIGQDGHAASDLNLVYARVTELPPQPNGRSRGNKSVPSLLPYFEEIERDRSEALATLAALSFDPEAVDRTGQGSFLGSLLALTRQFWTNDVRIDIALTTVWRTLALLPGSQWHHWMFFCDNGLVDALLKVRDESNVSPAPSKEEKALLLREFMHETAAILFTGGFSAAEDMAPVAVTSPDPSGQSFAPTDSEDSLNA
ncbi:hypothetical protein RI367_002200 [Sorochytrium milnesiophthora]